MSWKDIFGALPQVGLLEIIYDNTRDEGIYVGSDIGVYYKNAKMKDWIDYSKKLPAIRISGMDIFFGKNRKESSLTISTGGRGFWRSELYKK